MGTDLHIVNGSESEYVTKSTNATGAGVATPIVEISPTRGLFLRFMNRVAKGSEQGIPVYMDLRDSNGDPLPASTRVLLQASVAGSDDRVSVSETLENIDHYNSLSITDQRDPDNIDESKVTLEFPESAPQSGARRFMDIRDIDSLYVSIESPVAIDWSNSKFFLASNAVKTEEYSG